jgi:hypothetical protein
LPVWNKICDFAARCYPIVLLLGIVHLDAAIFDRASALDFRVRRNATLIELLRHGKRQLTLSAYQAQVDELQAAARGAQRSASAASWLLLAGSVGYLLVARETWKFRLSMMGLVFAAALAQLFIYPLH